MACESVIAPFIGMTPILSPKDRLVDEKVIFMITAIIKPKKTTMTANITNAINTGCFFPAIYMFLWGLGGQGLAQKQVHLFARALSNYNGLVYVNPLRP